MCLKVYALSIACHNGACYAVQYGEYMSVEYQDMPIRTHTLMQE